MLQDTESFIESLPLAERTLMRRLRALIFQTNPRIHEKISYGVPYFFKNRRLFFLWPASSSPSTQTNQQRPTVTLGFCYGRLLSNVQKLLISQNRKQVYTIPFMSADEINDRLLTEILIEAVMIDDEFRKRK